MEAQPRTDPPALTEEQTDNVVIPRSELMKLMFNYETAKAAKNNAEKELRSIRNTCLRTVRYADKEVDPETASVTINGVELENFKDGL